MKSLVSIALAFTFLFSTASSAGPSVNKDELAAALKTLKANDQLKPFFKNAYGYAVFPTVGRGSFVVGAAYSEGGVYKQGKLVAKTTLTAVSIGLGAGGEAYTEIIFFKNKEAYDRFVDGKVELGARANAVAAQAAVSAEAAYENGVAIFTFTKGGLMADASVGGQKFSYEKL